MIPSPVFVVIEVMIRLQQWLSETNQIVVEWKGFRLDGWADEEEQEEYAGHLSHWHSLKVLQFDTLTILSRFSWKSLNCIDDIVVLNILNDCCDTVAMEKVKTQLSTCLRTTSSGWPQVKSSWRSYPNITDRCLCIKFQHQIQYFETYLLGIMHTCFNCDHLFPPVSAAYLFAGS